jgi:threonyl-tRNA synthetase
MVGFPADATDFSLFESVQVDSNVHTASPKELFPDIQVTIGPAIENGFFYDFAKDKPFGVDSNVHTASQSMSNEGSFPGGKAAGEG